MSEDRLYVVQGHTGQWEDSYTFVDSIWHSQEEAEERVTEANAAEAVAAKVAQDYADNFDYDAEWSADTAWPDPHDYTNFYLSGSYVVGEPNSFIYLRSRV